MAKTTSHSREPEDICTIAVGLLGAGFIGQMHALALRNAATSMWEPKIHVRPKILAEVDSELCAKVGERFDWEECTENWRDIIDDAEIDLFINAGPNHVHAQPTIAAAKRGKHVFCEKPLASTADEAFQIWDEVSETGVIQMCAFMYRSIPALNLAREMIQSGEIGEVRHFRSRFLLNMLTDDGKLSWRFSKSQAGLGAMGDLGP